MRRPRVQRLADLSVNRMVPNVLTLLALCAGMTAMRFAGALVARQQFLPGLQEAGGAYYARWQPIMSGADAGLTAKLAQAMPPVCRALTRDATSPPRTTHGS